MASKVNALKVKIAIRRGHRPFCGVPGRTELHSAPLHYMGRVAFSPKWSPKGLPEGGLVSNHPLTHTPHAVVYLEIRPFE